MRCRFLISLVLAGFICSVGPAYAAAVATVTALNAPLWLLRDDNRTPLEASDNLSIGDRIATGTSGRAEIQLRGNTFLRVDSSSEITFRAMQDSDAYPELYVEQGRACINYTARAGDPIRFQVNLGEAMFAAIQLRGDICVLRVQSLSAVRLYAGSVELTHSVGEDRIILSEAGTELHIQDDGTYEMLFPDDNNLSMLEMADPFITDEKIKATASSEPADTTRDAGDAKAEETPSAAKSETSGQDTTSPYAHTVYLFSTREEAKAQRVNQRFNDAGYETQILAAEDASGALYRVGRTGFNTRQEAEAFADSIDGKLGVRGTWISKESD